MARRGRCQIAPPAARPGAGGTQATGRGESMAGTGAEHRPRTPPLLVARLSKLRRELFPGRAGLTALDAGAGDGLYTLALEAAGFATTAVEIDPVRCAHARARGVERLHEGDLFSRPFGDRRFDLVLARGFPPLLSGAPYEAARALLALREATLPGGTLLFWTNTDLSGDARPGGITMLPAAFFAARFDEWTLYPFHRLQAFLPRIINRAVHAPLTRLARLPRAMNVIALLRRR